MLLLRPLIMSKIFLHREVEICSVVKLYDGPRGPRAVRPEKALAHSCNVPETAVAHSCAVVIAGFPCSLPLFWDILPRFFLKGLWARAGTSKHA